jgi:PIN domain nuclease of toxin-antitoxin system
VSVVLDASALMAYLLKEAGQERVLEAIVSGARMTTVNFAEVVTRYAARGASREQIQSLRSQIPFPIVPLNEDAAVNAGLMVSVTKKAGLSLGDRCCLAYGQIHSLSVLTADQAWHSVAKELGVDVQLIRSWRRG